MKVLLYCICQQDGDGSCHGPGIRVVTGHGLMAVVSELEGPTTAPSVSSLLAYERVVEAIHARQTVIPLRYGCLMESEEQIVQLLEEHRREYEALLGRLHGMTEMGIRLLWPASAVPPPSLAQSPGAAYLAQSLQLAGDPGSGGGCPGRSDRGPACRLLHRAAPGALVVPPGTSSLSLLSDAEEWRRRVSQDGPHDIDSTRRETAVERAVASVQLCVPSARFHGMQAMELIP
jgi:hypothetical protein